jgi:hypothetical protein
LQKVKKYLAFRILGTIINSCTKRKGRAGIGKYHTGEAKMSNTKKAAVFQIVANVEFNVSRILRGAFNSYHKARLSYKGGNKGEVTKEGAAFFSNRPRLDDAQLQQALADSKYSLYDAGGFVWAQNAHKTQWVPGQGAIGQTLFANALSALTQGAHSVKASAKAKTTAPAKAVTKKAATVKAKAK